MLRNIRNIDRQDIQLDLADLVCRCLNVSTTSIFNSGKLQQLKGMNAYQIYLWLIDDYKDDQEGEI